MPKAERLRSKIHDLAGDTDTPVQQSFQERESRRLERLERKNQRLKQEADFEQFREEKQRNNPPSSKNPLKNRLAVRGLKREYQKEQLKKNKIEEENPAEDLFRKGKK